MPIPAIIDRYQIKSELGRGGRAVVYHAFDPSVGRDVAIKVLPGEMAHDPQFRVRFEHEVTMAGLEHPSIVPVYDVGEYDGQPYFVMRFMAGGSLSAMISQGKIPLEKTARIVSRIAQGLTYVHEKGRIHRDLKPDNILFDEHGNPFISDFGVARLVESVSGLTVTSAIGTPAYMSPEQMQGGEVDSRSDIYALGIIIYQMLTGRQPYSADTPMGVAVKHFTEPVPKIMDVMPGLPSEVDVVIKRAMAMDKDSRYPTAVELAKALNLIAFGDKGDLASMNMGIYDVVVKPARGWMGPVVSAIIILVLAVGVFLLRNQLFAPAQVDPSPVPSPTVIIPTSTFVPTSTTAPVTETASAIPFAPACAASIAIPTPEVKETNKICVEKKPYTAISVPEGAIFESLDEKMTCVEEATSNGRTVISCTGRQLYSYNLKVCVPPVVSNTDPGKCPQGEIFEAADQCCSVPPAEDAGCTVFRVNIGACQ
jgi:serine/threonine-protein kinase